MDSVKFSGKKRRSDREIFRNKAYNAWKYNHLKYGEFKKIDFVDQYGREYVFNEIKKSNLSTSEYSDPPLFLTDKYQLSEFGDPTGLYFNTLSLSVRIPKRMDIPKDLSFPETNTGSLYLFCKETGTVCTSEVSEMFFKPRSKSGRITLKNFWVLGKSHDETEFDVISGKKPIINHNRLE